MRYKNMAIRIFTAVLYKEGNLYAAQCPEVGTASQGYTLEEALANLKEATELYLEEFPLSNKKTHIFWFQRH
jgi:predicted RNase H-like HicB family nuclease